MSLLASPADFEPADENEGADALYYQPHDGSGYDHKAPYFETRIAWLIEFAPPANQKVVVWGCGFGSLVNHAVEAGYDAVGYDASDYAVQRGQELHPTIADRLFRRDALVAGGGPFDLVITEDLVTCMDDDEITIALPLLRDSAPTLIHMVTPLDPWSFNEGLSDSRINWKSPADWKSMLAPDVVFDVVAGAVA